MEESIQAELSNILNDLERIGQLVANKEAELGIVREVALVKLDANCYELTIDQKTYFLDKKRYDQLKQQIDFLTSGDQ